eukprot:CAMPEP_0119557822 /NCGR_PEP_ID=MMETSP1352-20130426/9344_1 /TAXON_ID=265584 /ORGANISM="Stauroneis constricta, Strain CCMP1120" /LENGTH=201 /DNA_ID=CAMNT_0007604963 /DNA_START=156 /DNA_END=759 /DNA_ORIENTATION=+
MTIEEWHNSPTASKFRSSPSHHQRSHAPTGMDCRPTGDDDDDDETTMLQSFVCGCDTRGSAIFVFADAASRCTGRRPSDGVANRARSGRETLGPLPMAEDGTDIQIAEMPRQPKCVPQPLRDGIPMHHAPGPAFGRIPRVQYPRRIRIGFMQERNREMLRQEVGVCRVRRLDMEAGPHGDSAFRLRTSVIGGMLMASIKRS